MIYFLDFDGTIADTIVMKEAGGTWKEKQKLIPQILILPQALALIDRLNAETDEVYIVSGNVGSTIKKAIKHFKIPVKEQNVYGYRQGMPMENLRRKIAVINYAIRALGLEDCKDAILYIGDEADDKTACEKVGINFTYANEIMDSEANN